MKPLDKKYKHQEKEKHWQDSWFNGQVYKWDKSIAREDSFVIDTPPPTVSGLLHMGHIFSYTQADFVARFQRMTGKNVFYPMGFDDNGLPTERLVEKVKKVRAANMEREEFISLCNEVVEGAEEEFRELFKSIALSVDWDQEYRTISKQSRTISQMSFLDLFGKDRAYRKMQPTLWDPIDRTALAQADIVDKEMPSSMNDIRFKTDDGEDITIATTRPELLAACVSVFFHPEDEIYKHLEGKSAITALFEQHVPIIADDTVDIEKGSGLVMCCTFGDSTDIDWWRKHDLPLKVIINKAGRIESEELGKYAERLNGKKIAEAREETLAILKEEDLLLKQEEISHAVKCAERSGAPLEILVSPQWFIKILDIKDQLHKKNDECNWNPEYMKKRMDIWIEGLSWDWCISRQRFFGVPFPAWYSKRKGEEGKVLLAHKDDLPVNPLKDLPRGYSKDEVEPDVDVMDTWATSSVSPQLSSLAITGEYAIDIDRHKKLFPADLRPQAHEIIRTWGFYTLAKAYMHEEEIPWKNLMISGWCLAADKTKMSKSKGNVVTPIKLIQEKGADVVRYWASTSKLGTDIAYSEDVFSIGKKLVTKLWNATKFAAIQLEKMSGTPKTAKKDIESGVIFEKIDIWAISKFAQGLEKATEEFKKFEYSNARHAIEDFFWNVFCDNYLEIIKARAYDEEGKNPKGQQSAIYAIYHLVDGFLKAFAPFLPHITEELHHHIFEEKDSIHSKGSWPSLEKYIVDEESIKVGEACVNVLEAIRKLKAENQVSIKAPIKLLSVSGDSEKTSALNYAIPDLSRVTSSEAIEICDQIDDPIITEGGMFSLKVNFAKVDT